MRRRRAGWLLTAMLPCLVMAQSGYDAQPIGRPATAVAGPLPPPRPVPRGYQPPPSPMLFEAPRSRYNSANPLAGMNQYRRYPSDPSSSYPAYQRPSPPVIVPHASARFLVRFFTVNLLFGTIILLSSRDHRRQVTGFRIK
ncbi:hypothetical protein ANCCAN_21433 [Ancylostoma caninum]|uniref:Uncharacterized protein n=1 Tax=Ancylostoma caninum TaxID=29170 RepID=A0A368FP04_ANCCA|nr:hypothetical protein ANCCAN_21433 [Ancylostoma caninum]